MPLWEQKSLFDEHAKLRESGFMNEIQESDLEKAAKSLHKEFID